MAAPQADAAQPSNIGRDGPVADMTYYELLEVSASATDLELKKAYRKAAIKYHPDKGGDEDQFKMVGEAYRVLSDSNERANYDKYGTKKPTDEVGVKEATEMFGQLFGGERFTDYIGEVSLLRDFGKASEIMMTDEERKEMEAQVKEAQKDAKKSDPVQQSLDSEKADVDATSTDAAAAAASASATPGAESGAGDLAHSEGKTEAQKKAQKAKLTPEQRAKLEELEKEKEAVEKKRIEDLTRKLIDRIRPFCEAKNPGDKDDSETQLFSRKMRDEAEDLKLESFGVELLHVIGNIYLSKSTTWVKTHKSNFLGLSGFLSRLKEKGGMIKETWGLLGTAINVQMSMEELAKRQEKGDIDEEELAKLEQEMSGKMLLATWRTTRWEVTGVLRKVCDNVLNEKGVSDKVLLNRARALAFLGAIYRNVQPDEGDDERRELERLVAEAAQKKKKPKASKKDKHAIAVSGAATPAETASPK